MKKNCKKKVSHRGALVSIVNFGKMPRALSVIRCGSRPRVTFSFCLALDDVMNINSQCIDMYAFHLSGFIFNFFLF